MTRPRTFAEVWAQRWLARWRDPRPSEPEPCADYVPPVDPRAVERSGR